MNDVKELKPSIFCAVPRVLDKIYSGNITSWPGHHMMDVMIIFYIYIALLIDISSSIHDSRSGREDFFRGSHQKIIVQYCLFLVSHVDSI